MQDIGKAGVRARIRRAVITGFCLLLALATGGITSPSAWAQNPSTPPIRRPLDGNLVDLALGAFIPPEASITIGKIDQYYMSFSTNRSGPVMSEVENTNIYVDDFEKIPLAIRPNYIVFVFGDRTRYYVRSSGNTFNPNAYDGSTITFLNGSYTYVGPDGVAVTMSKLHSASPLYRPSSIVYPDGSRREFYYSGYSWIDPGWNGNPFPTYQYRLNAVVDSRGYMIKFNYEGNVLPSDPNTVEGAAYINRSSVELLNRSAVICDIEFITCFTGQHDWPRFDFSSSPLQSSVSTRGLTDNSGRTISFSYDYTQGGNAVAYTNPGARSTNSTATYTPFVDGWESGFGIASLTRPTTVFTYSWSTSGSQGVPIRHSMMSGPGGVLNYSSADTTFSAILSKTDALDRSISYQYDMYWRIKRKTLPSGSYIEYEYDNRGNIIQDRRVSGSGGEEIFTSAIFPPTCTNPVTCNKPISTTDSNGVSTEYTYDPVHGGILTMTGPALSDGRRSQVRYSYTQLYPRILDASMSLVNSLPVWMITRVSECVESLPGNPASCVGTAAEKVLIYTYSDNLLKVSETVQSGDGAMSETTSFVYDQVGNITSIDGPLPGSDDTSFFTFDSMRRPIFEIGPDPDGSGSRARQVTKHIYDADGYEVMTQYGSAVSATAIDFVASRLRRMSYDPATGLLVKIEEGTL